MDEWQEATNLWDEIRIDVDKTGLKGQYILTGSSTPNRKGISHSGAGRYGKIHLRTMSLFESGDSTGDVSLKEVCNNNIKQKLTGEVDLRHISGLIIRGGWPGNLNYSPKDSSEAIKEYSEKRHFADPSIACALLNITEEEKLINDLNTFGFLFEAMVERDLKIYADSFNAKCYHYQNYQNKEVDAIIELENGEWCAFKIKLCELSNAIYKRPDGVYVVPITALKN